MTEPSTTPPDAQQPVMSPPRGIPISLVWLVPLLAVVIAVGVTFNHFNKLGPLVTITFQSAEGLEAGSTPIRFRSVQVGRVENIRLDEDLDQVVVEARMVKDAAGYLNENARFWVVRPRVGLSGISGLSTLLSGSYIEVSGVAGGGVPRRHFTGLENPPLTPEGAPGMRLRLSAQQAGSMTAGSPVFYRRVVVGRVESRRLSNDGDNVELDIFIDAPYHVLVNSNTRFWDASGFDITLDTEGVTLRSETMEAVITGGVAFSNPPRLQAGSPVTGEAVFTLYESREEAARAPAGGLADRLGLVLYFDESLHGLNVGAPVEFRGVEIGYVADISIEYSGDTREVKVPVLIFIEPHRIRGLSGAENADEALPTAVEHGLRARLQTGSLITGQLFVELVNLDDAAPASLEQSGQYAIFPTVPSPFAEISGSASVILTK
ncbi:MAG: MlaD family protein, partial [Pseudomonadota bacterium]